MRYILVLFLILVLSSFNIFGQKTYYGYQVRNTNSSNISDITLDLTVEKRLVSISLDGILKSYSSLLGDEINKDYDGKIIKIGDVIIKYDYNKRVTQIGDIIIIYLSGKMTSIGEYDILYDYNGNFIGSKKKEPIYHYGW